MIELAKFKHFANIDFEKYRIEVEKHYHACKHHVNWMRQWEYPWVLKNGSFEKDDIILDAGGGSCYFPDVLARYVKKITVLDNDPKSLRSVSDNIEFICQDISELNLIMQYDKVISISVIEHIHDWKTAIKNLAKYVKHNGLLIMTIGLDLNNNRHLFYTMIPELLLVLKECQMEIGVQDIAIDDEFTKLTLLDKHINYSGIENIPDNEERYTVLGVITRKI